MKSIRLIFDIGAFMLPVLYPLPILIMYTCIHVWYPWVVYLPKKLDNYQHPLNFQIPGT